MIVNKFNLAYVLVILLSLFVAALQDYHFIYFAVTFLVIPLISKYIKLSIPEAIIITTLLFFVLLHFDFSEMNKIVVHTLLIIYGILFFRGAVRYRLVPCRVNLFLTLNIVLITLQLMRVLPVPHFPRASGFLASVNELSAICLVLLALTGKGAIRRSILLFLTLIGGSVAIAPGLLIAASFLFRIIILSSILILLHFYGEEFMAAFKKITDFFHLLIYTDASDLWDDSTELSAFRRVSYFTKTYLELIDLTNYVSINKFQFREGALLTIFSLNPLLGLIFLLWAFKTAFDLIRSQDKLFTFVFFVWLLITPIVSIFWFFIFKRDLRPYQGHIKTLAVSNI